jgi:hypothetical protein
MNLVHRSCVQKRGEDNTHMELSISRFSLSILSMSSSPYSRASSAERLPICEVNYRWVIIVYVRRVKSLVLGLVFHNTDTHIYILSLAFALLIHDKLQSLRFISFRIHHSFRVTSFFIDFTFFIRLKKNLTWFMIKSQTFSTQHTKWKHKRCLGGGVSNVVTSSCLDTSRTRQVRLLWCWTYTSDMSVGEVVLTLVLMKLSLTRLENIALTIITIPLTLHKHSFLYDCNCYYVWEVTEWICESCVLTGSSGNWPLIRSSACSIKQWTVQTCRPLHSSHRHSDIIMNRWSES